MVRDEYKAYDSVTGAEPERFAAGCLAHARRKFYELPREGGRSAVATEALQRIAQIYPVERELAALPVQARPDSRQAITKPMWEQLHAWFQLERDRVPDGSATAKTLSYSLNAWAALTRHLVNGEEPVDNNHREKPDPSLGYRHKSMALLRKRTCRATCRGRDEPGAVGQAPWP